MSFTLGSERILYLKDGEDYKPVGCLKSNPISEGVDMLETTTRGANGWKTSVPTTQYYNIPFDGIQIATGTGGDETKFSYDSLKTLKRSRAKVEWKIEDSRGYYIDEGEGYITEIGEGNDVGGLLVFNGNIEGYGEPVFSRSITGDLWQDGDGMLFQNGNEMIFN